MNNYIIAIPLIISIVGIIGIGIIIMYSGKKSKQTKS
jgi:hypothetical protein